MFSTRTQKRMALLAIAAGLMLPVSFARGDDNTNRGAGNQGINSNQTNTGTGANTNQGNTGTNAGANTDRATAASDRQGQQKQVSDRDFVTKAANGGLAEVKLGQLATQRAQSAEVKQFAQKMVDDHSKANDQLKELAQKKGFSISSDLMGEEKEHVEKFQKITGADFDREYVKHMVEDHQKDVQEFRNEAQNGQDQDVKAWAAQTLPTLEQHLKQITQVAQGMGVEGARTAGDRQGPDTGNTNRTPGDQQRGNSIGNQPNNRPSNQGNTGNQPQQPGTTGQPGQSPTNTK